MLQFDPCECLSPDHHGEQGRSYYVSAMNERRTRAVKLAGPFDTHREALDALPAARRDILDRDPRGPWYLYGTASEVRAAS